MLQGNISAQEQELQTELSKNGQQLVALDLQVDHVNPHVTARLFTRDKTVDLYGGLLQPNQIRFTMQRKEGVSQSQMEDDINIGMELSPDGKVLKIESHWRPDLMDDAKDMLINLQKGIVEGPSHNELSESLDVLQNIIKLTVNETAENLQDTLTIDLRSWTDIAERLSLNLQTLYINQISDLAQSGLAYFGDTLAVVMTEM